MKKVKSITIKANHCLIELCVSLFRARKLLLSTGDQSLKIGSDIYLKDLCVKIYKQATKKQKLELLRLHGLRFVPKSDNTTEDF